ncbi:hypothetical protein FKM82_012473 [Ascaphus truei]
MQTPRASSNQHHSTGTDTLSASHRLSALQCKHTDTATYTNTEHITLHTIGTGESLYINIHIHIPPCLSID